ncbi:spore germination protein [Anaerobacillus alkalidiazotrophicus]|uniref:Spore germination protein n=1 Tax=Anaerobacillus alkalidiazotrophicus TaxID=472963 RepID=A0A1S2M9L3_9BACI|nr:spore germination protein [Anaerobacillus alkalidiazotrophicus]OIJ21401.1 spore germination protein [Anaerobacillus alkalidiazotrophicus]
MNKIKKKKPKSLASLLNKKKVETIEFIEDDYGLETNIVTENLINNINYLKETMGFSNDLVTRELIINHHPFVKGFACYIAGLVDEKLVSEFIIKSLIEEPMEIHSNFKDELLMAIQKNTLTVANVSEANEWNEIIHGLLSGKTILFIEGINQAILGGTQGGEWRSIEEPTSEITIRGPKDGFNESLKTNISLIRRRIKSPHLRPEILQLGTVTQTDVAIVYIEGIANPKLVQEVKDRINRIEIDEVLASLTIEELIQDHSFTPFPTIFNTERPDIVANTLVDGRVVIIVDGTPFVLIAPTSFAQFFKAAEDYYQRYDLSTLIRILRYLAFSAALLGPSIYIALITFHQDLIPTTLVISLAAQREGIPFPAFIEALIMEVMFEVLREAGVRMPRAIGQAVSIVGALVIGQAAVQAGIVSAAMVIVVAGTAICSFTTPAYSLAIAARILRFAMMILAATMGLYGIILGLIIFVAHLCSLRSFGYPYLAPFAPFILEDQKDGLFRFPLWARRKRPRLVSQIRSTRMKQGLKPTLQNKKSEANDNV